MRSIKLVILGSSLFLSCPLQAKYRQRVLLWVQYLWESKRLPAVIPDPFALDPDPYKKLRQELKGISRERFAQQYLAKQNKMRLQKSTDDIENSADRDHSWKGA